MKTREELGELHILLTDTLSKGIKQMHMTEEYNPSLLNCARQHLKDNDVILMSGQDTPLNDLLSEVLPFEEDPELLQNTDLLYEPSKEEIIDHLTPKHVKVQVWRFLLESFASEQAARMVAMENATSNSEEMIKDLTLKFNKARQAAITTEMLEIVGGAEALKG